MSSTSSSDTEDEEERKRLEDIVGSYKFESCIQAKTKKDTASSSQQQKKTSLRYIQSDEQNNVLQTTPECRNFISRKLDEYLESVLCDTVDTRQDQTAKQNCTDVEASGVKLLNQSTCVLNDNLHQKKKKKRKYSTSSSENDSDSMERFRSAAVTMEHIAKEAGNNFIVEACDHEEKATAKLLDDATTDFTTIKEKKKKKKKKKKKIKDNG
ncbi:protein CUSTOS-like [Hydractinia symbiolongicarpus]|uniref:protein CUSTOS-like n=1 Tax=Hydractinia symbiolongicarpus TaxID=13093 RepID=UPI00254C1801|nr:protein CUSTOS-like [Hydractinia symbiolongicarpus]